MARRDGSPERAVSKFFDKLAVSCQLSAIGDRPSAISRQAVLSSKPLLPGELGRHPRNRPLNSTLVSP
jgi:hypothetical protein